MRHASGRTALVAATGAVVALLVAGCSSAGSQEPAASHSRTPHRSSVPSPEASSSPTTSDSPSAASSSTTSSPGLAFDPASGGPHSSVCFQITGTTPVDYTYYPVIVTSASPVTLDQVTVTYVDGVQVAGSWVAPAPANAGTGFVPGWPPPSIVTQGTSVQWSQRVQAEGAELAAGTPYNVFLHLRVYPDSLPYTTKGIVLTYHDATGSHEETWVNRVTFQSTKC